MRTVVIVLNAEVEFTDAVLGGRLATAFCPLTSARRLSDRSPSDDSQVSISVPPNGERAPKRSHLTREATKSARSVDTVGTSHPQPHEVLGEHRRSPNRACIGQAHESTEDRNQR